MRETAKAGTNWRTALVARIEPGTLPKTAYAAFSHPDFHRRLRILTGIHLLSNSLRRIATSVMTTRVTGLA